MQIYNVFAKHYDALTANIDYQKRGEYFHEIINKYKVTQGNILLDLGCGTGSLTEVMARLGYDVIGVDNSPNMLVIAVDKKIKSKLNIQYIRQDMRWINMFGTIDVTVCALDSINHLTSLHDVECAFKRVSLFTEPEGLFIFDLNTIYKHQNILSNNTFTYETDEVYCVWENHLNPIKNTVRISLNFFERGERNKNGVAYYRSSESFTECTYSIEQIDQILIKSGFNVIDHYDADTFNPPHEKSERIVVAARKKLKTQNERI